MSKKQDREGTVKNPKEEKAGWWNDHFQKKEYVQNEQGHWHVKGIKWPPA